MRGPAATSVAATSVAATSLAATSVAATWLAAILGVMPARAQTLEVSPVSVALAPGQRTAILTVTNRGSTATVMQVRPFVWRENDGPATLTETAALAASPPFAEVAPGASQSIRLLLREPPGAAEESYRLLVDQIPPPATVSGLRIALRLSLPVFALPQVAVAASLDWEVVASRSGAVLQARNRGTRHATIVSVQANAPSGARLAIQTSAHPYVLPGATARWPITGATLPNTGTLRLKIISDTGALDATAPIVSRPP